MGKVGKVGKVGKAGKAGGAPIRRALLPQRGRRARDASQCVILVGKASKGRGPLVLGAPHDPLSTSLG